VPSSPRTRHHHALGAAIRELRACERISQEELGFRCGLHRNYVGAVERGELNPTYGVLVRLCTGFGIGLAELVTLAERRAAGDVRHDPPSRRAEPARGVRARARCADARARTLPLWDGRLRAQTRPSASYSAK
jgi:transcriptional regulator with XRE-family HTH domain